jgi:formate/nitrite transporter FocA (FNT family)
MIGVAMQDPFRDNRPMEPNLGFAASRVLGGAAFSLGLLLVVVAGAELFTGNNLLAMAWAQGALSTREVLGGEPGAGASGPMT